MTEAATPNSPTGPDSALLALVAKYHGVESEASRICEALDTVPPVPESDPRHAELSRLYKRGGAIETWIAAIPARTPAGLRAKAGAALAANATPGSFAAPSMVASTLRDVMAA